MPKKPGKKRNKVDPVIQLALKNQKASLDYFQSQKNEKIVKRNKQPSFDEQLASDKLFREMKKREF